MTDAGRENGVGTTAGRADVARVPLDDVMIAMDVVDTLRHDDRLVARELADADRRAALIERLREIYSGQGIEVPDRILEEGVKALEDDRFVYTPPGAGVWRTIWETYASRMSWGRYVGGAVAAVLALWAAHTLFVAWPQQAEQAAIARELSDTLPAEIQTLSDNLASEANDAEVRARAAAIAQSGINAAGAGDLTAARAARTSLQDLLDAVRAEYDVRIVNRPGELTGLWRIPDANPDGYNYYLVVEAVAPDGRVLALSIENEETGKLDRVKTWAVRVSRDVLTAVEADKRDDGIIQSAIVGTKRRGETQRNWSIPVAGGTITRW